MAVWRKEDGSWKLLADQVTDIVSRKIELPINDLTIYELLTYGGTFELQRDPKIMVPTKVISDTLNLFIPNQIDDGMPLLPSYDDVFFSTKRPWKINFQSKDSIIFTSWGIKTTGIKK